MTAESAFYTRHIYSKLLGWTWGLFVSALIIAVLVLSLALTRTIPDTVDVLIARTVYSVIPIVGLGLARLGSSPVTRNGNYPSK